MINSDRKFERDLVMVILSNIIVLLSSILTGFIIPKLLGITEYGYYKIFSLYLGYVGLLHFGFVDGILLCFAGKEYSELDKKKFRRYTVFFFEFQLSIAVIIIVFGLFFLPVTYKYMFFLLGIDVICVNLTTYYQFISQSTMRFKELSTIKTLLAIGKIILVLLLLYIKHIYNYIVDANIYITGLVVIDAVLLLWYIITYKEITFGEKNTLRQCLNEIKGFFINGIILTLSYQTAQIIFLLDRQFVSAFFDTDSYSVYSFAYSLIAMVTTVVSAISLVIFPRLRQMDINKIMSTYKLGISAICVVAFFSMLAYQPLCLFIKWFLPDYYGSIEYLRIIFPGLSLSSCISIIMFTFYKALEAHVVYFRNSCFVLAVGVITNTIAFLVFRSPSAISFASIVTMSIWFLINDYYFISKYKINEKNNYIYIVANSIVFYLISGLQMELWVSWILYLVGFIILTLLFEKGFIISLINRIK